MIDQPGVLVDGRFELRELVGKGGMATVWKAVLKGPAAFESTVALKRMLPSLAEDPELVTMFVEEAKIAATLSHPNVTRVFELGRDAAGFFLVMEWVDGLDLEHFVRFYTDRGDRLPWWVVVQVVVEALSGLDAAHGRIDESGRVAPVFHRDVDPRNVLVARSGVTKLTDFGLAFASDRARLTQPGILKGKLAYLAPELLDGDGTPSIQSDVYSMGVVLWEALAGAHLYLGANDRETLENAYRAEVPPLGRYRDDLPGALEPLLLDALARDPSRRIGSAHELAELLRDVIYADGIRPSAAEIGKRVAEARSGRSPSIDRARTANLLFQRRDPGEPLHTPEFPLVRKKT